MFDKITRLAKHSAVYGVGTILGRAIGFLLIPLYTRCLRVEEYGLMTLGFIFIAFAGVFYSWGLNSAFLRYFVTAETEEEKRQVFSTVVFFLLVVALGMSVLLWFLSGQTSELLFDVNGYSQLMKIMAVINLLDALRSIFLLVLRAQERSTTYTIFNLLEFILTIGSNIIFLLILKRGLYGIFESNLITSALLLGGALRYGLPYLRFHFSRSWLKKLLAFGLPYIPAVLAELIVDLADRYILQKLSNSYQVGLYSLGYRFGMVVLIPIKAFAFAWPPFFLSIAKESDAREVFARVLTYFLLICTLLSLFVSLFAVYAIRFIATPEYLAAASVVPIILIAYTLYGVYVNLMVGVYVREKTKILPLVVGGGALVNLLFNFLLIPDYGKMGAAWATFASYAFMVVSLYYFVNRFYPVKYEWWRISKIIIVSLTVWTASYLLKSSNLVLDIAMKSGFCLSYLVILRLVGFFEKTEIERIKSVISGLSRRVKGN